MSTPEERLKAIIGDLIFQNAFLTSQLEAAQAELAKLRPEAKEKDNVVKLGE